MNVDTLARHTIIWHTGWVLMCRLSFICSGKPWFIDFLYVEQLKSECTQQSRVGQKSGVVIKWRCASYKICLCLLVKSPVTIWTVVQTVTVLPHHLKTLRLLQVPVHAFNRSQNSKSFSTVTAESHSDSNDTVVTLQGTDIRNDNNAYPFIMPLSGNISAVSTAEPEIIAGVDVNQTTAIYWHQ